MYIIKVKSIDANYKKGTFIGKHTLNKLSYLQFVLYLDHFALLSKSYYYLTSRFLLRDILLPQPAMVSQSDTELIHNNYVSITIQQYK